MRFANKQVVPGIWNSILERFQSLSPAADLPRVQAILAAHQPDAERQARGWYTIQNITNDEAEILLYDEISSWGISANDFLRDLNEIKASKITMRINSPGGNVFDSIAIYNAVKRHPATVTSIVDGIAASCASWIALAADKVLMAPHSQMMIHEASGLVIGPAEDMRKMADILDKSSDNIATIYQEKAGGTTEEWRDKMREETWFSDQEAVDAGLADGIDGDAGTENRLPDYDFATALKAAQRNKQQDYPDLDLVGAINTGLAGRGG